MLHVYNDDCASEADCDAVIAGDWPHGWRICLMGTQCH